jgi:predicted dehydrogenase
VSLARWIAGEEPSAVQAYARFDERGIDRTFLGQLRFPGGLLAQFDCGFAAPDRERIEIVGGDATIVLDVPFLPEPEGPPPSLTLWRGRDATPIEIPAVDQYAVQAAAFTAAVLDGATPRPTLASSRGNVVTLVALDAAARRADAATA